MKREYKFSSVLIILLVTGLLSIMISSMFAGAENTYQGGYVVARPNSFFLSILSSALISVAGFVIASGLLRNRKGSIGEYLNHINNLSLKSFGVIFLIQVAFRIVLAIMQLLFVGFILLVMVGMVNDGFSPLPLLIVLLICLFVLVLVSTYFYNTLFVVADMGKDLAFSDLLHQSIKLSNKLLPKGLKEMMKFLFLPIGVFLAITLFAIGPTITDMRSLIFSSIGLALFSIGLLIYIVFALAILFGRLSDIYLDYKNQQPSNNMNLSGASNI